MSLERSSSQLGGFQIRHRRLRVYQGSSIGLAFWHPSSGMPEYGLCRFSTEEKGREYIDFLCSEVCAERLDRGDMTIEPFNLEQHEQLIHEHPLSSAWELPF